MQLSFSKSLFIKTQDLENALKKYALSLGVEIIKKRIKDTVEVEKMHPNCKHFIAADGAKSLMRVRLLGKENVDFEEVQNIIELKFSIKGKAKKSKNKDISSLLSLVKLNYESDFLNFEYLGNYENEETPITTRIFMDKETFENIPEATFLNPISVEDLNTERTKNIYENIQKYLTFRKEKHGDVFEIEEIKITKLILSLYAAKYFAIYNNEKDTAWFLTGDAAMGVPYFRALNSGMILSSRLAQILNSKILKNNFVKKVVGTEVYNHVNLYNIHRPMHIKTEFVIALGKNYFLNSYNKFKELMK